jgi:hypothetical protein
MPKPSTRRPSGLQQLRSKGALGLIAGLIALGFIGSLIAFNDPVGDASDPTPTVSNSPNPTTAPEPKQEAEVGNACDPDAKDGQILVDFDSPDDFQIVAGEPELQKRTVDVAQGEAALTLDNQQNPVDGWVEYRFSEPQNLSKAKRLNIYLSHNGNIASLQNRWRIRLFTGPEDFFERAVPGPQLGPAAIQWCHDSTEPSLWSGTEGADWSKVMSLQVMVPGYAGSGAKNAVSYDAFGVVR